MLAHVSAVCGVDILFLCPCRQIETGSVQVPKGTFHGQQVEGFSAVFEQLAASNDRGKVLLGAAPETQALVHEMMTYRNSELHPNVLDDKLRPVNEALLTRAFIAGNQITIADFAYYATAHQTVAGLPVAQLGHFGNLLRWYDFCQHTLDTLGAFPKARGGVRGRGF